MADVTIKYKGATIAEMSGTSEKTLKTGGTYCEDDIEIAYAPRSRTYEVTIGSHNPNLWNLLTPLDEDVLEHINDATFTAALVNIDSYFYEWYTSSTVFASNTQFAQGPSTADTIYGFVTRQQGEAKISITGIFHPANYTGTSIVGGYGAFRVASGKYYFKPGDGYMRKGNYRLTFSW